jgi:hypothetical protein
MLLQFHKVERAQTGFAGFKADIIRHLHLAKYSAPMKAAKLKLRELIFLVSGLLAISLASAALG